MKLKIKKISFFPKNGSRIMHLPVDWEIEVEGDMTHFHNRVQVKFCDQNANESDFSEAVLNNGGEFIAFDLVDLSVKIYSDIPYPKYFFGSSE